jgi:primosomal protein N' (replication factor Y)
MPRVQVVDMRAEMAEVKQSVVFSRALIGRLKEALGRGEQGILFLNRRGYSPVLWCRACGETVTCDDCSSPMNLHKRHGRLVCHTCCGECLPPTDCPSCTAPGLRFLGAGSERVEALLEELLPEARVRRMDSDTMLRREDYEQTLAAFGKGEIDLLVGTQMIAKGLDFPRVTVVGIISADSALHLPDFRAAERTFQLVSQVAGRAGRADLEGHIVIQTVAPQHHAIVQAARHDFETFAGLEMGHRKALAYPPFGRLIRMVFEDEDETRVKERAQHCAEVLRAHVAGAELQVLGPAPAPFSMVRGRHREHLLMKVSERHTEADRLRSLMVKLAHENGKTRVQIDVDPVGML